MATKQELLAQAESVSESVRLEGGTLQTNHGGEKLGLRHQEGALMRMG